MKKKIKNVSLDINALQSSVEEVITALQEFRSTLENQNGLIEGDLSQLGTHINNAFELLEYAFKLAKAFSEDAYDSAAIIIYDCLVNLDNLQEMTEFDNKQDNAILPLAPINSWIDLLMLSYFILENENQKMMEIEDSELLSRSAFHVDGMHVLLDKFAWIIELSQLPCMDSIEVSFKRSIEGALSKSMNLDWSVACERWIRNMRMLLGDGIMRAFIKRDSSRKKETSQEVLNDNVNIEDEVTSMLMCPMLYT